MDCILAEPGAAVAAAAVATALVMAVAGACLGSDTSPTDVGLVGVSLLSRLSPGSTHLSPSRGASDPGSARFRLVAEEASDEPDEPDAEGWRSGEAGPDPNLRPTGRLCEVQRIVSGESGGLESGWGGRTISAASAARQRRRASFAEERKWRGFLGRWCSEHWLGSLFLSRRTWRLYGNSTHELSSV